MKTERLQDALGMVREDYVLEAHSEGKATKKPWRRWGTLAACLCLITVCAVGVPKLLDRDTPTLQPDNQTFDEPGPETAEPGMNPAEPQTDGDWPVIYNNVNAIPDRAHYVAIAGRPLTKEEKDAVIPACLRSLKLESAEAMFGGYLHEDGRLYEDALLDSVELRFTDPDRGCRVHVGLWSANQNSIFTWASQFNPEGSQVTNFGSDSETRLLTLYECGDAVWTYFTIGGVSYYVGADAAFRDGIGDRFYSLVLALLRDSDTHDLSILVPNP